ncbi:MAG: helix-turn-helix transcriptional regulator [Sphingomonadaceae bacterium]|nr:helix-turn-helix transcriptional regulator [Sphingomonadaceae bacterium]
MDADSDPDIDVSQIAAAIGDPGRARILFCLMDGHARTSTELSVVADVGPSTASAHLNRLKAAGLVRATVQGRHRYYNLTGSEVADVLESLGVLAGGTRDAFTPTTPSRLRLARTCYDHMAGAVGVSIHDGLKERGWLLSGPADYELTPGGAGALESVGVDVEAARRLRRRFAFGCLDWSERRPHLGGGLGAAVLKLALQRKWVLRDIDSRSLCVTHAGRRELKERFGAQF